MRRSGTDATTVPDSPEGASRASDSSRVSTRAGPGDPLQEDASDTPLPERFEPIAVIGRGGMGKVVRCRDRTLNREVAVKLMHQVQSEQVRQRFLHEARAIGALHHPNIVTVHDAAPAGEYLVMELVDGESLASRLHRGRLPAGEVHRIARALLGALAAAHRHGIIHRDVKPGNILLDRAGTVKLTDFGIASISDSELTHTGDVIGTPAYMAPEQLRGGRATERADIYAAGATLFEAATGTRLFTDGRRVEEPSKDVLDATGDTALAAAIAKAVREEETERFDSAEAFDDALARKERPRRRWLLAPVLVVLAVAGVAIVHVVRSGDDRARSAAVRHVTIAMLPFDDRVGDPRLDFASSGLPHLLGEQLGHVEHLKVLGYYRVSGRVADSRAPLTAWFDAARALGADVTVRGELVAIAGGAVRVSIIVERRDGRSVDRIEREVAVDQVPATVQSLASAVASAAVGAPLSFSPHEARAFEIERDLELGIAALERMDLSTAYQHLNTAVTRDESLAVGHYYLAILEWWRQLDPDPHIERALAGSLSPTRRDFLVGLHKIAHLQYPDGVDYFRALAARVPDDRDVQYGLFEALFHGGYPTESMQAYRRLRELAPRFNVGIDHPLQYYLERGDAAGIAWVRSLWDPGSPELPIVDARALFANRGHADAVRMLERAVEEQPDPGTPLRRMLVEAYAVTGQLALARQANDRLAADPSYATLARFGLALARGEDTLALRVQARHAVELGISGVKPWASRLDLLALDLPAGNPELLRQNSIGQALGGRIAGIDVAVVILARAMHDTKTIEAARHSPFPQVAAVADAVAAEEAGDRTAAIAAWRRSHELNSDGRMQLIGWYVVAQHLRDARDHAGVIAACDEIIAPRVFMWAWASTVGPCLQWSAEAAAASGHEDDARRRWRSLLAIRSGAPARDELIRAARAALGDAP